jgi:hypothetical protein
MSMSGAEDIRTDEVGLEAVGQVGAQPAHDECDQCGAPVDRLQRYCVSCGAHRHHVPDPAARYLAQASARARGSALGSRAAARPPRRRLSLGPLTAALAAAVLAGGGVAVGAAIDGGHGSDDAQLLRTLHHLGVASRPAGNATGAGSQTSGSSPTANGSGNAASSSGGSGSAASPSGGAGKPSSSSTAAERLQHATGKSYRKQAQQLPNSVAIP